MGEYNHTIDAKGRLIIPSKYREVLGDEFVVSRGLDGCLFVYDKVEWAKFQEEIYALPLISDSRHFSRYFMSGAVTVEVDKQGRILLPASLREFAKLDKDVKLIGAGRRAEIWNRELYEQTVENVDIDEVMARMSAMGLII